AMLEGRPDTELLVRAHTHQSLARILDTISSGRRRLIPFGMTEDTCSVEVIRREYHDVLARAIHEQFVVNRRMDSPRGPDPDAVLAPWRQLTEDLRESNRQQADHIPIKLRAIGCGLADPPSTGEPAMSFTTEEVEVLARMEHARWIAERWIAGWTYAPRRNVERRENPHLVPWEQLTEEIKGYDRTTVSLIPRLLESVGKTIRRAAPDFISTSRARAGRSNGSI
ncbi:MAG: hypothetical protein KJ072_17155, partial [Verrucomicrobia bacterium]|nr:hypothetical protein [Verrucomicrobiota bacterium]